MPHTGGSVGVALCTYNGAAWVERQLRSVLEQTRPPDELVVSDGGSTDQTLPVVRRVLASVAARRPAMVVRLLTADPDVRLDVRANFERALANTTSSVVFLADQDDRWVPTKVETQLAHLTTGVVAVASDARVVRDSAPDEDRGLFETLQASPHELALLSGERAIEAMLRRNIIAGMSMAVSRELIDLALPIPRPWPHDAWLATLAASVRGLRVVSQRLVEYMIHGANTVGVQRRTLSFLFRRLIASPSTATLYSEQYAELIERLRSSARADAEVIALVEGKLAFERARAAYPTRRILRPASIAAHVVGGDYARFGSAGIRNAARDLLTPGAA